MEFVGPGFGGFAATRFATHVAMTQIAQRKPTWGKHAGAGVSVGAFLLAWFLGHRVKFLAKYQMPITVGSAIAAIQSLLQIYVPKVGWMVSDATPELATAGATSPALDTAHLDLVPANDDPNEYTYNDEYDPGRYAKPGPTSGVQAGTGPGGSGGHQPGGDSLADLEIDDAIGQTANMGVFSN